MFRERLKNPNMPYLAKKGLKKKILGMIHTRFSGHTFLEKVSASLPDLEPAQLVMKYKVATSYYVPQNKTSGTGT